MLHPNERHARSRLPLPAQGILFAVITSAAALSGCQGDDSTSPLPVDASADVHASDSGPGDAATADAAKDGSLDGAAYDATSPDDVAEAQASPSSDGSSDASDAGSSSDASDGADQ